MTELQRTKEKNEYLLKKCGEMQERVDVYEAVLKTNAAYIALLLQRVNADEEHPVIFTQTDIQYALSKLEARAKPKEPDDSWQLYYVELEQ